LQKIDVLIIGGGPAGATAAVYTARAGFETMLIYKDYGALEKAERVDNFYGFSKISGKSLVEKGLRQARACGAKVIKGEVVSIVSDSKSGIFSVETTTATYTSKVVLLATGSTRAAPNIQGLAAYEGRGISHCAICDGFFYRGKDVAVLGNGAYALHEATELLPIASSVTLLTNGEEPNVDFPKSVKIQREKILEFAGGLEESEESNKKSPLLAGLSQNKKKLKEIILAGKILPISAVFIAIGSAGGTDLAKKLGAVTSIDSSVKIDINMKTSIAGLWAAGDCTDGLKQIVKAAYDGTQAAIDIVKFLRTTV